MTERERPARTAAREYHDEYLYSQAPSFGAQPRNIQLAGPRNISAYSRRRGAAVLTGLFVISFLSGSCVNFTLAY